MQNKTLILTTALIIAHRIRQHEAEYYENERKFGRSNYCIHGNYVGSWAGPDYMCGLCESPVQPSVYEEALYEAKRVIEQAQERASAAALLYEYGSITAEDFNRIMQEDVLGVLPKDTRPKPPQGRLP